MLGKNGKCKQPHSFELMSLKWWMTRYVSFFVSHTPYSIHKQSLRIKNIVMQHPTLSRYKIQQRDSYKFRTFLSLISRVLHVVGGAENEWMVSRQKLRIEQGNLPNRDKRVTEIDWNLWYAIFSTCSIVYKYCTRPIRRHLYSGIFKDSLDTKHKIFKNRLNS